MRDVLASFSLKAISKTLLEITIQVSFFLLPFVD
jgi:hypothetical protein